jgi:hypothetical protein
MRQCGHVDQYGSALWAVGRFEHSKMMIATGKISGNKPAPRCRMAQFYVNSLPSEGDVRRCEQSQRNRERITITGATESGEIRVFTGIVQSIDYFPAQVAGRQYRVTILDT